MSLILKDAEDTMELGRMLAEALRGSSVRALYLFADLGGGKTTLTRGFVSALPGGENAEVASPSFTILNVYDEGRVPLYHFDWYRLNDVEELYEMGMEEYLGGDGVAVVEWPSQCPEAVPESYLEVNIVTVSETEREIILTPCGDFRRIDLEANDE